MTPHPRLSCCLEGFNTYFRRMMTALLSLMSCGRMQCVISSAAYPLTTETKSHHQGHARQKQKVVSSLNNSVWSVLPNFHQEFLLQTPPPRHTGARLAGRNKHQARMRTVRGFGGFHDSVFQHTPEEAATCSSTVEMQNCRFRQLIYEEIRKQQGEKKNEHSSKASSQTCL